MSTTKRIPLDKIAPDPKQPRKTFAPESIAELAASIEAKGLLQPITVRRRGAGTYWIALGECRWRAHKLLRDRGLKRFASIDCNVRQIKEGADLRIAQLAENMQRADMEPMDEARAFADLVSEYAMTPEDIAAKLGLAPFRVRWRLQLLNLTAPIARMVESGQLDRQQALEIARVERPQDQTRLVQLINRGDLVGWKSVRNAADAILQGTTQSDLFGDEPVANEEDVAVVNAMEDKIERVVGLLNGGWRNGQCVVAAKVSPDRAGHLADRLAAIRGTVSTMERELRNFSAQATIALAG